MTDALFADDTSLVVSSRKFTSECSRHGSCSDVTFTKYWNMRLRRNMDGLRSFEINGKTIYTDDRCTCLLVTQIVLKIPLGDFRLQNKTWRVIFIVGFLQKVCPITPEMV